MMLYESMVMAFEGFIHDLTPIQNLKAVHRFHLQLHAVHQHLPITVAHPEQSVN